MIVQHKYAMISVRIEQRQSVYFKYYNELVNNLSTVV